MRISTLQAYRSGLGGITTAQAEVQNTQTQIASGKRVQRAADDPVAAARILRLEQDIALRERYRDNIASADSRLGYADATMEQGIEVLQRVRELAIQARGPALTDADRASIATEISARFDELVSLVNSPDANGDYLFGGYRTDQPPFVEDASGRWVYQGDQGVREQQVSETIRVPVTTSGFEAFVAVPSVATTLTPRSAAGNGGDARVLDIQITDQDALDALAPANLRIEFNDPSAVAPPASNFTVRNATDGTVVEGLANVPYSAGASISVAGAQFDLHGSPETGDVLVLETSQRQDVLSTIAALELDLRRPGGGNGFETAVANLDLALDRMLEVRSGYGARLNTIASVGELHADVNLLAQATLSSLQDIDYAEAVSRLNLQTFVLEAAQQSFARIANLSLFNRL